MSFHEKTRVINFNITLKDWLSWLDVYVDQVFEQDLSSIKAVYGAQSLTLNFYSSGKAPKRTEIYKVNYLLTDLKEETINTFEGTILEIYSYFTYEIDSKAVAIVSMGFCEEEDEEDDDIY